MTFFLTFLVAKIYETKKFKNTLFLYYYIVAASNRGRTQWKDNERDVALKAFKHNIIMATVPKKAEVAEVQSKEPLLRHMTWRRIKDFVNYKILSRKISM